MNVATQRKIDRLVGVPLCRLMSLLPAPRPPGRNDAQAQAQVQVPTGVPARPKRVLIVLLSEMGSLVLARPMLRRLVELHPRAELYALVFRQNAEAVSLLDAIPPSRVLTLRNDTFSGLVRDGVRVVRRLRRLGLDIVIDCELFSRVSALLSRLIGAPIHVGFHRHRQEGLYRGDFMTHPVPYNPHQHIAHQFLTLAEATVVDVGAGADRNLRSSRAGPKRPIVKRSIAKDDITLEPLVVERSELDAMRARLARDFPQLSAATAVGSEGEKARRLVLLYVGGGLLPIRAWPLDSFKELASRLVGSGFLVGVIGLESDKPLARVLVKGVGADRVLDLTGYTATVRELSVLFHLAELLITNDGGPGHFAARTPIASVILYGPETPTLYGSLDPEAVCVTRSLSCSPCLSAYNHRDSPCDGDNQCLKQIAVDEVLAHALALLERRET